MDRKALTFEPRHIFDEILEQVKKTARENAEQEPQAFIRWFINMYFLNPQNIFISDGPRDGKIDAFFETYEDEMLKYHVINSKFTSKYEELAPGGFYDEIIRFTQAFDHKAKRNAYLQNAVKQELRSYYQKLFEHYDMGSAGLIFLTNHRRNDAQMALIPENVKVIHLEDLTQFMIDDIDMAMPRTPPLVLTGVHQVITPGEEGVSVSTSIVFARLIDFIKYMMKDRFDLLFARNVRYNLGNTDANNSIKDTFENAPLEFAFSNNGITVLCEKYTHEPATSELTLENPRVVNGSQTLHSIRDISDPSEQARVMVRIVRIPALTREDLPAKRRERKELIKKIALRSNLQNPIKKWELVANDDFQLDLFRYFRGKGLYYERRKNEWNQRSRELQSAGLKRGPKMPELMQLLACYFPTDKRLGPAIAKGNRSKLFITGAYDELNKIPPSIAYQLYRLDLRTTECYKQLSKDKKYIRNLKRHSNFALFALLIAALNEANAPWGNEKWSRCLEAQLENRNTIAKWERFTKACIDEVFDYYKREKISYRSEEGKNLTYTNYFKNQSSVSRIFEAPLGTRPKETAQEIVESIE